MKNNDNIWNNLDQKTKVFTAIAVVINILVGILFLILNFCGAINAFGNEITISRLVFLGKNYSSFASKSPSTLFTYFTTFVDVALISLINVILLARLCISFRGILGRTNKTQKKDDLIRHCNALPLSNMINIIICAAFGSLSFSSIGKFVLIFGIIVYAGTTILFLLSNFYWDNQQKPITLKNKIITSASWLIRILSITLLFLLYFRPGTIDPVTFIIVLEVFDSVNTLCILSILISVANVAAAIGLFKCLLMNESLDLLAEGSYSGILLLQIIRSAFAGSFTLLPHIIRFLPAAFLIFGDILLNLMNKEEMSVFRPTAFTAITTPE